jgi:SAM-dependent methyltransferase
VWSSTYDQEDNPLIAVEEPAVMELVEPLPVGSALDACCGTGRYAARLASLGYLVSGVDSCEAMLAQAAAKVPTGRFSLGRLETLPFPDACFDLAMCCLALTHQPSLASPLAELARVVRPGGHVLTSDIHTVNLYLGGVAGVWHDGTMKTMPAARLWASDYIRAAHAAGLEITDCIEPTCRSGVGEGGPDAQQWCPDAAAACYRDAPAASVWLFHRRQTPTPSGPSLPALTGA